MKKTLLFCVLAIILGNLLFLSSCADSSNGSSTPQPAERNLDWTLYARQLSSDGEVLDEFQFTVTGTVPVAQDMYASQKVTLDIVWPDTFRFVGNGPETYNGWASSSNASENFYFLRAYFQYPSGKEAIYGRFGIAPEKGYMLFLWDDTDTYLVASTDPNTPPGDIKVFFANMLSGTQFS